MLETDAAGVPPNPDVDENPVVTMRSAEAKLSVSRPTALRLLKRMEEQGVLEESGVGLRGQRRYVARRMMAAVSGDSG